MYYIYKITNKLDGKNYIGQTFDPKERRGVHRRAKTNSYIHRAIRKYGWNQFEWSILEVIEDRSMVLDREAFYMREYNSIVPYGYNLTIEFGERKEWHFETRTKISSRLQGKSTKEKNTVGVCGPTKYGTYRTECRVLGKRYFRSFESEDEALEAYDKMVLYLIGNNARINKEEKRDDYLNSDLEEFYNQFLAKNTNYSSQYLGVSYNSDSKTWIATYIRKGQKEKRKVTYLGSFKSEIEAAERRDKHAIYLQDFSHLNFPDKKEDFEKEDLELLFNSVGAMTKNKSSKYIGVNFIKNVSKWRAYMGKVHLGCFASELEAAIKRDEYVIKNKLKAKLNFPDEILEKKD